MGAMDKMHRVAVVGLVHDHVWSLLNDFVKTGKAELVAAADPNQPLLDRFAERFGVTALYSDYEKLLDEVKPEMVLACVENNRGHEVVKACAARGVHVISEKPMAASLAQADEMLTAAEQAGITLMINWPSAWSPALDYAFSLAKAGELGHIYKVRNLSSHGGPKEIGCDPYFYTWLYDEEKNGAGALMDYCCYGAVLCRYILGVPQKVSGIGGMYVKDYINVDDNAVLLVGYEKAIGICEASWTQIGHAYGQYIFGSKANLYIDGNRITKVDEEHQGGAEIAVPPLPQWKTSGPAYFIHCIENGLKIEGICNPRISRDAQEILEAGKLSVRNSVTTAVPVG